MTFNAPPRHWALSALLLAALAHFAPMPARADDATDPAASPAQQTNPGIFEIRAVPDAQGAESGDQLPPTPTPQPEAGAQLPDTQIVPRANGAAPTTSGALYLLGSSRSEWPVVTVGPTDGTTYHQPTYFADPAPAYDQTVIDFDEPASTYIPAALEGSDALNWDDTNAAAVVIQPVKFAFDLVTAPLRQAVQPFWAEQASPR